MKILIVYYLKNQSPMSDSDAESLQNLLNMPVYLAKDSNKLEGRQYPYFDIKEVKGETPPLRDTNTYMENGKKVPITKDNA